MEQHVRETKTREAVHFVGTTENLDDGRKQVLVHLLDKFKDARAESPAAAQLMAALEADGWVVEHSRALVASRLVVSEPATPAEEG
ncbi:hypothetical protein ACIBEJ_34820 [Nonomuraea sp. NPDC050790]|uniref:hypothetical protein n=1 Tax=Nonomuraea sp. NPDC050790 TaxID=3364371 RepID=UPI0037A28FBF